ncbi:uncharacterized protein FIESC28_01490 [Fusarium coffeatum]|uniref:Uncharacterized protein n=1 Tax=Fusarium coffeatum TaxID=231269 RepID=A0A366S8S2_9HYPO|nr:uncharacterized protein FIESC28_01490 [Fusarium coffeatum]RBR25737.1 hypothetical protein FIESC28_01490 [Fusarium coffeatum]
MPVKESDVFTIPEEAKWIPTPVTWRQTMKEFNKTYMRIEFTNTRADEPEKTNFLFVLEEMLENFKSSKIEKTETGYKLTVDEDYLFGQQRAIFQHRFVEGTIVTFSQQATEASNKLGYGEVKMMSAIMGSQIGNKLYPMSDASK